MFLTLFYSFFKKKIFKRCQIYHLKFSEFSKFQNLIMRQACFPREGGVSRGGAQAWRYRLNLAFLVISVLSRYTDYKKT